MFRKKDFVENGFLYDEEFKYAQDMELWSRAMFKLNFHNIPIPLLKMRFGNSNSISFKHRKEQQYFGWVIVNKTMNRLGIMEKWDFEQSFLRKILLYNKILKYQNLKIPYKTFKSMLKTYFPNRIEKLIFTLFC